MSRQFVVRRPLPEFALWEKMASERAVFSFDLEMTARCNLDCRHCYINLPAGARAAKKSELSADEIGRLGGEAAALGAVWCLITGAGVIGALNSFSSKSFTRNQRPRIVFLSFVVSPAAIFQIGL